MRSVVSVKRWLRGPRLGLWVGMLLGALCGGVPWLGLLRTGAVPRVDWGFLWTLAFTVGTAAFVGGLVGACLGLPGAGGAAAGRENRTAVLSLAGAFLGPPALMSAYVFFSHWPVRWFSGPSDWNALCVAVVLCLAAGGVCLARLPVVVAARVILVVLYVPLGGVGLLLYSLAFFGVVFEGWS